MMLSKKRKEKALEMDKNVVRYLKKKGMRYPHSTADYLRVLEEYFEIKRKVYSSKPLRNIIERTRAVLMKVSKRFTKEQSDAKMVKIFDDIFLEPDIESPSMMLTAIIPYCISRKKIAGCSTLCRDCDNGKKLHCILSENSKEYNYIVKEKGRYDSVYRQNNL